MSPHLSHLEKRCPALQPILGDVQKAFGLIAASYKNGGSLYLCGNGGSAADCEHWSGELLKGFYHKRPLSEKEKATLPPELASKLQGSLPAIPLTGFLGLATAFANDVDAQLIYAQLLWGLGKPNDILIAISTSGNAVNVRHALDVARAKGIVTIGFSGKTGGAMKPLCDLCICVPESETYRIQEYHLPIYHCLCLMLEDEFFPPS
ncbi:MAG: SIS domain-containing protein [Verrucomicrobiota bacterium]